MIRSMLPPAAALALAIGLTPHLQAIDDPIPTPIPPSSLQIDLQLVASGLTAPNLLTHANDGSGRLFVVDQIGLVRVIDGGVLQNDAFLDVTAALASLPGRNGANPNVGLDPNFDERGLLGLAFHPGYADPQSPGYGKLYTYHSEGVGGPADFTVPNPAAFNHQSVVTEWTIDNVAASVFAGTSRELIRIDEPQFNHNAGMLAFGHDELLYIGLGDGGAADDQGNGHNPTIGNGQDLSNVLGTILRIDPVAANPPNGKYGIPAGNPFQAEPGPTVIPDEIFAYGLRNPFRFSFDRQTGQLVIADVGQNDIEEVNRIDPAGDIGVNFGWAVKEGTFAFDPKGTGEPGDVTLDEVAGYTEPVAQYDHTEGSAIIGGHVYRGAAVPQLDGLYIFGDFSGRLFVADLEARGDDGLATIEELIPAGSEFAGANVLGFGEDADGEVYVLLGDNFGPSGTTGRVVRLVPEPAAVGLLLAGAAGLAARGRARRRS